jgi:HlyD family secretion protein
VWIERGGRLTGIAVKVGLDDDSFAEIRSGDLHVGDTVVVSQASGQKRPGARTGASAAAPRLRL